MFFSENLPSVEILTTLHSWFLYLARHPSEARRCSQLPSDLCELLGFGAPKAYAHVSRPGGGSSVQLTGDSDGGTSEYVAPAWEPGG